jgi:hypothetical protein
MYLLYQIALAVASVVSSASAFSVTLPCRSSRGAMASINNRNRLVAAAAAADDDDTSLAASKLVVVSPPGGVGEVAAVKAAQMGSDVRWFVVSQSEEQQQVVQLSQQALKSIEAAGGSIDLAGSDAMSLLLPAEDPNSAIKAMSTWTESADAMICTFDTADLSNGSKLKPAEEDSREMWRDAIKVAAKEVSAKIRGKRIAILSAFEEEAAVEAEEKRGIGEFVGAFLAGKAKVPLTLSDAMSSDASTVHKLRYGQIFGVPESSPDFCPLVGGPKKEAELCEEYSMRIARVDPTLSVAGNVMMGSSTLSSRLAVGEAAVLMALGKVSISSDMDVCVSSQRGTEQMTIDQWEEEFERVKTMISTGQGARLFSAEFASVPDVGRLADWLATKWAPAIMRSYDIATIRTGERPVLVSRVDNKIEIIWQQLVNFQSETVGKLIVEVSDNGLVAVRGAGDLSAGFDSVSTKPLNGEDVFVRLLSEAASQAVEKGLAKKARINYETGCKPFSDYRLTDSYISNTGITEEGDESQAQTS